MNRRDLIAAASCAAVLPLVPAPVLTAAAYATEPRSPTTPGMFDALGSFEKWSADGEKLYGKGWVTKMIKLWCAALKRARPGEVPAVFIVDGAITVRLVPDHDGGSAV